MDNESGRAGWWQASDGQWYPPNDDVDPGRPIDPDLPGPEMDSAPANVAPPSVDPIELVAPIRSVESAHSRGHCRRGCIGDHRCRNPRLHQCTRWLQVIWNLRFDDSNDSIHPYDDFGRAHKPSKGGPGSGVKHSLDDEGCIGCSDGSPTYDSNDQSSWDAYEWQFNAFYDVEGNVRQLDINDFQLTAADKATIPAKPPESLPRQWPPVEMAQGRCEGTCLGLR